MEGTRSDRVYSGVLVLSAGPGGSVLSSLWGNTPSGAASASLTRLRPLPFIVSSVKTQTWRLPPTGGAGLEAGGERVSPAHAAHGGLCFLRDPVYSCWRHGRFKKPQVVGE